MVNFHTEKMCQLPPLLGLNGENSRGGKSRDTVPKFLTFLFGLAQVAAETAGNIVLSAHTANVGLALLFLASTANTEGSRQLRQGDNSQIFTQNIAIPFSAAQVYNLKQEIRSVAFITDPDRTFHLCRSGSVDNMYSVQLTIPEMKLFDHAIWEGMGKV